VSYLHVVIDLGIVTNGGRAYRCAVNSCADPDFDVVTDNRYANLWYLSDATLWV
jgi:hypothetical protein